MLVIQAKLEVQEGQIEVFLEAVGPLIEASRAEAGNVSYNLTCSVENTTEYYMLEEWEDLAAIDAHNKSKHFQDFQASVGTMLASAPRIQVLSTLEGK
ncbi:putative quinol monooxygenase [Listeria booriae]|uniref:putative quinol monooxygenase n=1 Tax=Listeria booriae TaxID=1552123 RepID=UPI001623362F|nr:putative quinol monooxygenase [Listeria booriae]MBC2179527.1 antibiotic biosynthesis monooxygenase [Listeria booriae]MBC2194461.1 antibiotic biosynthesis monooxygenase [Listeria booriae]